MKCSVCGYMFPIHGWEGKASMKDQVKNTMKKVRDHYVRDHRDIVIIASLIIGDKI